MEIQEIVKIVVSAISGGGLVKVYDAWSSRHRGKLEAAKIRSETKKMDAETDQLELDTEIKLAAEYKKLLHKLLEESKIREKKYEERIRELDSFRPNNLGYKAFQELLDKDQDYMHELIDKNKKLMELEEYQLFANDIIDRLERKVLVLSEQLEKKKKDEQKIA